MCSVGYSVQCLDLILLTLYKVLYVKTVYYIVAETENTFLTSLQFILPMLPACSYCLLILDNCRNLTCSCFVVFCTTPLCNISFVVFTSSHQTLCSKREIVALHTAESLALSVLLLWVLSNAVLHVLHVLLLLPDVTHIASTELKWIDWPHYPIT